MTNKFSVSKGFTLAELVVCAGIATMTFVFAAPALNKGRDGTDRLRCENNLRQLSQAHLMYAGAHAGLPPMALSFNNSNYQSVQPGPGGWYDGHGWYSLIGPYIGEPEWASTINLSQSLSATINETMRRQGLRLKIHACPADIGLQQQEWNSSTWARVLANYVVNAGNTNYGQRNSSNVTGSIPFRGAPFTGGQITPLASITDGLSNTLLMSEIPVLRGCPTSWGGTYSDTQSSLGGQIFTGLNRPNSHTPTSDGIGYGFTGNGTCGSAVSQFARYKEAGIDPIPINTGGSALDTYITARSRHPGGVNATLCDGSAGFIADTIDRDVWQAMSSARGADFVPPTYPPPANARLK